MGQGGSCAKAPNGAFAGEAAHSASILTFHPLGDPRNNTHRQNWTQLRDHDSIIGGYMWRDTISYVKRVGEDGRNGALTFGFYGMWWDGWRLANVGGMFRTSLSSVVRNFYSMAQRPTKNLSGKAMPKYPVLKTGLERPTMERLSTH